jgi:hypothetical protein
VDEAPDAGRGHILRYAVELERAPPLPSAELLQAVWGEHCDPTADPSAHPTRPFVSMVPREFLDLCEHY